ncbi:MAG: tRNA lysidine(34) synthetase TilS, partial [Pseudomonadota bacterium]
MSLTKADIATVRSAFDATSGPLGLAVSGGGDSLAMAALASDWAVSVERPLFAVTVDHGLRPESASEAQSVGAFCREFGIAHDVVVWDEWAGRGNLQDAARQARKRLIGAWAKANGISHVATGHTLDDQAETVLLRLARGSGVDGLAAMAPQRVEARLTWHRPLLGARRTALRDYLSVNGIPWIDDPSNEDTRFDRVRVRQALAVLAPLGIEPEGLVATAARMARARHGL